MKVSAVNISEQDMVLGLSFLQQEASQGLPLISANLMDASRNAPVFPPYVIKTVNNIRVAFFGLLSPDIDVNLRKAIGKNIVIKDPIETAQGVMDTLRGRADIVILLSDIGMENEKGLLKKVPGIRFVLGGREAQFSKSPVTQGSAFIFQSYKKGMYAGKLQLSLTDASAPFREEGKPGENHFQWTLLPLNRSLPEDKTIFGWIHDAGLDKDNDLR